MGVPDISHIPQTRSRCLRWDPHCHPRDMRKEVDRDVTSQNFTMTCVSGRQASATCGLDSLENWQRQAFGRRILRRLIPSNRRRSIPARAGTPKTAADSAVRFDVAMSEPPTDTHLSAAADQVSSRNSSLAFRGAVMSHPNLCPCPATNAATRSVPSVAFQLSLSAKHCHEIFSEIPIIC